MPFVSLCTTCVPWCITLFTNIYLVFDCLSKNCVIFYPYELRQHSIDLFYFILVYVLDWFKIVQKFPFKRNSY